MVGDVTRLAGGGSPDGVASGITDGPCALALFRYPVGIAVDTVGTVFITAMGSHLIRMISSTGTINV